MLKGAQEYSGVSRSAPLERSWRALGHPNGSNFLCRYNGFTVFEKAKIPIFLKRLLLLGFEESQSAVLIYSQSGFAVVLGSRSFGMLRMV